MTASVQPIFGGSRHPASADAGQVPPPGQAGAFDDRRQWPVDSHALARCRALLSGHGFGAELQGPGPRDRLIDVPAAYESFCRNHFASVHRLHPELRWEDARPVYALALSAHAVLCEVLDDEREQLLASHWDRLRGGSRLDWSRARPLLADGCRALDRLDPLAMHR